MNKILTLMITIISQVSQILAIIIIGIGMLKASVIYVKEALIRKNSKKAITIGRLELGLSFSLGLGFLIGSSILKSTITPTWDDIGKLLSIILIRTFMNYFLQLDIEKANNELNSKDENLSKKNKKIPKIFSKLKKDKSEQSANPKDKNEENELNT